MNARVWRPSPAGGGGAGGEGASNHPRTCHSPPLFDDVDPNPLAGEGAKAATAATVTHLARLGLWLRRHRGAILALQWGVVLFYVVVVAWPAFLPLPVEGDHVLDNLTRFAQFLFWGIWWPFVILSMMTLGRVWCGLFCPEGALTEWSSRFGLGRPVPRWMKWAGWPFVAFVLTTLFGQMTSVYEYPKPALLILGGSTLAAVAVGLLYGRGKRVWCRHLCPVSGVFGLLARVAPLHFAVDRAAWDAARGPAAPVHCAPLIDIRRMQSAAPCHMCGQCAGQRGAVALALRAPAAEILAPPHGPEPHRNPEAHSASGRDGASPDSAAGLLRATSAHRTSKPAPPTVAWRSVASPGPAAPSPDSAAGLLRATSAHRTSKPAPPTVAWRSVASPGSAAPSPDSAPGLLRATPGANDPWPARLLVFGMLGVALGAFQWSASPWFVAAKQAAAEWLVARELWWALDTPGLWWLFTHYPEANDAFSWLDGGLLLAYIGAEAALVGGWIWLCLRGGAALAGLDWTRLALALIPFAGTSVFVGLSLLTTGQLSGEGMVLAWANPARLALLALAALWSISLAWRLAGRRRWGAAAGVALAAALPLGAWHQQFYLW